jgi:hypothetical protein
MTHPNYISESLETNLIGLKYLNFFVDPGSGMENIQIQDPG